MSYLALNQQQLSRFSHHWFWGLCVDIKSDDTFYDGANRLQTNPAVLQHIEEQVLRISQRFLIIQWVYWALNVGQYRLNYYQLHAYWSLQLYQKGNTMFANSEGPNMGSTGAFLVGTSIVGVLLRKPLKPYLIQSLTWFRHRLESFLPNANELPTLTQTPGTTDSDETGMGSSQQLDLQPEASESEGFIASFEMLDSLRILGLGQHTGELVSLQELKSAYRQSRLQTHPDKTRKDTNAEFAAVNDAYQTLISLVERGVSSDASLTEWKSSLLAKMVALEKKMQEEHQAWREMAEISRRQNEHITRQRGEVRELLADYRGMHKRLDALEAALGLPPLSPANVDGFREDPHYFQQQDENEAETEATMTINRYGLFSQASSAVVAVPLSTAVVVARPPL